jgi:energy-coupling factor transport system permease protein
MPEALYAPGSGLLYRLDPRSKLVFAISLTVYLAIESDPAVHLVALAMLHVLALFSEGTRTRLGPLWKTLVPLLVIIVLLGSVRWRARDALLAVGPVTITLQALWAAIGLGARILGLSVGLSLLLWTTDPGDAVAGLTRLGLPFELSFPTIMALQYVATFRQQFQSILEAQQSRGLTFSRGNPIQLARAYIPVLVPLMISALRSADSLALALQSRGFAAGGRRTSRRLLCIHVRDWIFVLVTWGALAALWLV